MNETQHLDNKLEIIDFNSFFKGSGAEAKLENSVAASDKAAFVGQELSKSDRPELASAKVIKNSWIILTIHSS